MTIKLFLATALLALSPLAQAAQIIKTPISNVTLTYAAAAGKVSAHGTLISGAKLANTLDTVSVNKDLKGTFEIDEKGLVRLALRHSGAFLVGKVNADNSVVLDVPFQAYQVSEIYDAIQKSFGMVDVEYITIDVAL